VAGQARYRIGVAVLALYIAGLLLFGVWAASLRPLFQTARFQEFNVALLWIAGGCALILGIGALRRRPLVKLLGLVGFAGVTWVALLVGPTVPEIAAIRWREQFHLVPYGTLALLWTFIYRRRIRDGSLYTTGLALCLLVAMADEALQCWTPGRVGDVGDVLGDALGAICGLWLAALVLYVDRIPLRLERSGWIRTLRAGALTALAFAAFYGFVHVAYPVQVPGANASIRSRFRADELRSLSTSWRPRPVASTVLGRLRRGDDFYADEGWRHVSQRNLFIRHERLAAAYQVHVALATFFAAYLAEDAGRQLPPGAVVRLESMASVAQRLPIDLGPAHLDTRIDRLTLWLLAIALASGLALAADALQLGMARSRGRQRDRAPAG